MNKEQEGGTQTPEVKEEGFFGESISADGAEKGEEKKETPADKGGEGSLDVAELKGKVEEMGNNLSKQREFYERQIKELTGEIAELRANNKSSGGGGKSDESDNDGDVPFKDIKYSKDLSEDELDDMTEAEIKLFDELAAQKELINKLYSEKKAEQKQAAENSGKVAQDTALEVAKEALKTNPDMAENETELANMILEELKQFNLEGLTEAQIKERVEKSLKLLDVYEPPKEQENARGKAVDGSGGKSSNVDIDKIVDEAVNGSGEDFDL